MLRHEYGRPVIFISLLTYIAPVLRKIPVLPPSVGGRQGKVSKEIRYWPAKLVAYIELVY